MSVGPLWLLYEAVTIVRVVGSRDTAKIRAILTSMHGALLETQIDGFRRWNLDELRLVKRGKPVGEPKN